MERHRTTLDNNRIILGVPQESQRLLRKGLNGTLYAREEYARLSLAKQVRNGIGSVPRRDQKRCKSGTDGTHYGRVERNGI